MEHGTRAHTANVSEISNMLQRKEREAAEEAAKARALSAKFSETSGRLQEASSAVLALLHLSGGAAPDAEPGSPAPAPGATPAPTPRVPAACALIKTRLLNLHARVDTLAARGDAERRVAAELEAARDRAACEAAGLREQLAAKQVTSSIRWRVQY